MKSRVRRHRETVEESKIARRVPRVRSAATRHTLLVTCEVSEGTVSAEEAREWVEQAIQRYAEWRAGWVGIGARGRFKRPVVSIAEQ